MALQDTLKDWDEYTQTDEYKTMPRQDREVLSRKFLSQKVATLPEYRALKQDERKGIIAKVRGIDTSAPKGPTAGETFGKAADTAFKSTLTGAAISKLSGGTAPTDEGYGFLDSFGGALQNFQGGGTAGLGQGIAAGAGSTVGALSDPLGLAVDAATAGVGGKMLSKAPLAARALATGAASGAIQGGGVAALQGGNVKQATVMGAMLGGVASGAMAPKSKALVPTQPAPIAKPRALPAAPELLALPPAGGTVRRKTPAVTPPGLVAPAPKVMSPEEVAKAGYSLDDLLEINERLGAQKATPQQLMAPEMAALLKRDFSNATPADALDVLKSVRKPSPNVRRGMRDLEPQPTREDILDPKSDAPAPTQAGGSSFLRQLVADETGSLTPGAAARGLRDANDALDRGLAQVTAVPGRLLAAGVNAVTRKETLRAGVDDVTGEDLLGRQAAEGLDWLRREAGNSNPYMKRVRQFLMSDMDLPAGYADARELRATQGRQIAAEGSDIATRLREDLTPEQQVELYRVLNDRELTDTSLAAVSEPVRQRITELSKELVDVGSITAKAHAVHENQYLRRLYEKYYNEQPAVVQWMKSFTKDVKGTHARGKERELSPQTAALFNKDWQPTGRTVGSQVEIKAGNEVRLVSKQNVGNFLGTWREVGKGKGGKMKYRRDWTEAERETMGEIRLAPVAIEETFKQAARDLANGRLLKDIASNPEWSLPAQAVRDGAVDLPEGWVLIDEANASNKANKSGLPRWGALAGHYVEPNIARDLVMAYKAQNPGNLRALMAFWKKNKTVYNLKSHVNNFMQNAIALELNGASIFDLPEAARILREQGDLYKQMETLGVFDNSFAATEFANGLQGVGVANPWNLIQQASRVASKADQALTNAYQGADDWFRVAYVARKVRDGVPIEQAAKEARERFYNGSINSPFIQGASNSVLPFIKPVAWSAAEVPKMMLRNPAKVAKLAALYWGWNELSKLMTGDTSERVRGREAMYPPHQRSTLGEPKIAQMPFRDSMGQPLIADIQNYLPTNFAELNDASPWGLVPQGLMPSGPLVNVLEFLANHDFFRDKEIVDDSKPLMAMPFSGQENQVGDALDYWARALGPSTVTSDIGIPGVTRGKLLTAIQGQADYAGRRMDVPTALANLVTKVQPFNEQMAFTKMADRYDRELADIQRIAGMAASALASGAITREQYLAILQGQQMMRERKMAQMQQSIQQARPALEAAQREAGGAR